MRATRWRSRCGKRGEETGLADLAPWPDGQLRHVAVVGVPAAGAEPAHEHADLRFVLATRAPGAAQAESAGRAAALAAGGTTRTSATSEANLRETLSRVRRLLAH